MTAELAVNGVAAQASMQVAVGGANGFPAAWTSVDGGSGWTRAAAPPRAVLDRPGSQQLTSVTHGTMGWLAVGGVTAGAAEHPVVVVSADGTSWQAADSRRRLRRPGLFTEQAAADGQRLRHRRLSERQAGPERPALGPHRRRGLVVGGPDGLAAAPGTRRRARWTDRVTRQMTAVAASSAGFVAVGSPATSRRPGPRRTAGAGARPTCPLPVGATRAVLQHVASTGRTVAAVGTAITTTGQQVPFAASSSNGGASWISRRCRFPRA